MTGSRERDGVTGVRDRGARRSDQDSDVARPRWMAALRDRVVRVPGGALLWRVGIAVIGLAVVVGGIILLPLPGPGWVIIFIGLGLWATEFAWAGRLLKRVRAFAAASGRWFAARPLWLKVLISLVIVAVVAGVLFLGWQIYRSR